MSIISRRKTAASGHEQVEKKRRAVRPRRPGPRGWVGRGRGEDVNVEAPAEFRGTSKHVCGLWPWIAGSGTPMIGVPLGRHLASGATVCCDPISWYQRGGIIPQPSGFILGLPGIGKTSLVMRIALGLEGYGVIPLVLGDTRPDYSRMIKAIDGEVIPIGRGRGSINLLDPGEAPDAAERLRAAGFEKEAEEVLADSHGLRLNMLISAFTVMHHMPIEPQERNVLSAALSVLDEEFDGIPVPSDLLALVQSRHPALRESALDKGNDERYDEVVMRIEACLMALSGKGEFGSIFAQQTSAPMQRDRPMSYDVSAIPASDTRLRALALLACWTAGFASVNISQILADTGVEERRHYVVILDELHQALKAGPGLVDRVDYLTRLNRTEGVGLMMITHTLDDLESLPLEADVKKAKGFIRRSAILFVGGLTGSEHDELSRQRELSLEERRLLSAWQDPAPWDSRTGKKGVPPGRGKFLIKVGPQTGIPIKVDLTEAEKTLSMSDDRWRDASRRGSLRHDAAEASRPGNLDVQED